jgi:hypothetical protein
MIKGSKYAGYKGYKHTPNTITLSRQARRRLNTKKKNKYYSILGEFDINRDTILGKNTK